MLKETWRLWNKVCIDKPIEYYLVGDESNKIKKIPKKYFSQLSEFEELTREYENKITEIARKTDKILLEVNNKRKSRKNVKTIKI